MKWLVTILGLCFFMVTLNEMVLAEEVYKKDSIVHSILADSNINADAKESLELIWGLTEPSWSNQELFITVHKGQSQQIAAVYLKINNDYRLLKRIEAPISYFNKPNIFWFETKEGNEQFIQITSIAEGTGHINTEYVFHVVPHNDDLELESVKLIPAPESYKNQLQEGEGVWKGEINTFNSKELSFEFYIWNKSDSNCCPTAGHVLGTYELKALHSFDGKRNWIIEAKSFERLKLENDY